MLAPVLVMPPVVAPVTLDDVKAQGRIDGADEDGLLQAYIEVATQHLDGWSGVLGRALVTQTWRQDFGAFDRKLRLPLAPVQAIDSITYHDGANVQQTLSPSIYALRVDAAGPFVELAPGQSWPSVYGRTDAVSVTFIAGYGDTAESVPAPIRHAIMLLVAHWYEHREATIVGGSAANLPMAVSALTAPYRRIGV